MLTSLRSIAVVGDEDPKVLTFIVMPCFNEAVLIEQAVQSLGYAPSEGNSDAQLIIVDNGSTDGTINILERLSHDNNQQIHVMHEAERGYVAPRRKGVAEAALLARRLKCPAEEVLILQADADTVYKRGYVTSMRSAASYSGGSILEGATRRPPDFEREHTRYIAAERLIDGATEQLDAADEDEVVVDDKACGYWLSDYMKWGGLFEEWTEAGDPIHAETTRMFIRARLSSGASKVRVNPAGAASSRRRVVENARLQFATSGFPREQSWVRAFNQRHEPPADVDTFARDVLAGKEPEAAFIRRAHQIALFRFLPALVMRTLGVADKFDMDIERALEEMPPRERQELADQPGLGIIDALRLIDSRPELFD